MIQIWSLTQLFAIYKPQFTNRTVQTYHNIMIRQHVAWFHELPLCRNMYVGPQTILQRIMLLNKKINVKYIRLDGLHRLTLRP